MDGWWNEDGFSQEPWEDARQENPFARNSAAAPDEHNAQPEPTPEPALRPGELYGQDGSGAQQHSFSQIRQGDLYGYAAPEAAPAPAFPGQDPFSESAGDLPFGAFDPDPLTGQPPLTGGVPFFGSGDGGFAPGSDTGAFMPFQTSYAGFPPLTGNTSGRMQPVDPNMPWQSGNTTGNMPPVDPNMPWLGGNTTGNMPPVDPSMPWQGGNTTGNMPPVDPNMPWQSGNTTGNMPPVDPNMQWQAPAGTTPEDWILPAYPEADPNWQPPEGEAPATPDFLKEIVAPPKPEDPNDRLNIPVYLRKPKLERKRPTGKPIRKPEAAEAAAVTGAAAAEAVETARTAGAAEAPAAETANAADDRFTEADSSAAEAGTPAETGEAAAETARTAGAAEAPAAEAVNAADDRFTEADSSAAEAGTPAETGEAAAETPAAADETPAEGPAAPAAAAQTGDMTDSPAGADEPQPGRTHRTRRSHSGGSSAAEITPEGDIYYTDAVYMRPSSLKPFQPAQAQPAENAAPDTVGQTQPENASPDTVGETQPENAAPDTVEQTQPENASPDTVGETQPVEAPSEEASAAEEPKPRRSRLQERQNAALQPAPSLPRKRRSQPQPESAPEGTSAPFVKAAAAEDTGDNALSARPLTEAASLLPAPAAVQHTANPTGNPAGSPTGSPAGNPTGNPSDPHGGWPVLNDPDFTDNDSYRFRQLFGQQPLYGDLPEHTGPLPLPGPAADDPNVPYADELLPPAPATDEAIEAAAMQDAALETALSGELRPLAPGELYGDMPSLPPAAEAAAAEAPVNPYAAAFGAATPQPPAHSDLLLEEDWPGEEELWTELDFAPVPEAEALPEPFPAGEPAPAADAAPAQNAVSVPLAGPDPAAAPESSPEPLPDAASGPLPPESVAELMPEPSAAPLFPLEQQPFPSLNTLEEPALQPDPAEPSAPHFGTSSYDAGAMPNPSRGNLPYEVVSAFDTDSRRRAELLAAQYIRQQAESAPELPLQPDPIAPGPAGEPKPARPPIRPMRVVLLAMLALMAVFCLVMGGRLLLGYVQNTEEWASFYRSFSAENGMNVNQAGEMVQLRSDGSTFPPSGHSTSGPLVTPLPQTVVAGDVQSSAQSISGQGRSRQSTYYGNELRNILEPMATPHRDYPEVMGRIIIPGVVDEWLVQRNNTYYLNHNYHGNAEEGGAVFIDAACTLDTPPENLHLRASDSAQGQTFQPLWQYKTEGAAFALGASHAFVTTLYEQIDYQLVAVFEASLEPGHPMYFNYASSPTFATDAEMMNYIVQVRQRSLYALPTQVLPDDRLLTLSTVSGADTADEKSTSLVLIFAGKPKIR